MANRPMSGISMGTFDRVAGSDARAAGALAGIIIVLGRALFVLIFLMAGPSLFTSATAGYAAQHGLPLAHFLVPAAGVVAILGGLSVLLGYRARTGAWLIVLFLAIVTPVMHNFWAAANPAESQQQLVNFLKNLSMLGGALLLTQFGAGPWSLDARRK